MNNIIHSRFVASVSKLKENPMKVVNEGFGEAVAILNRNTPAFYCVPAELDEGMMDLIEEMMELIEDREVIKMAEQVDTTETVKVSINDLRARVRRRSSEEV